MEADPGRTRMEGLARRVEAIRDPALHGALFSEYFGASPSAQLVEDLDWLLRHAHRGSTGALYLGVAGYLLGTSAPSYHLVEQLYRAAREAAADGVALLFLDPPARRNADSWTGEADPALMDRTLGERKWMARRPDRVMLQRLVRVAEPDVVRILLHNPRLTERDVVWIAARRPNKAAVLVEVARARRWQRSLAVRLALVQNPYTPPRFSVALCPTLPRHELRRLAREPSLHPMASQMVQYLVRVRDGGEVEDEAGASIVPFKPTESP